MEAGVASVSAKSEASSTTESSAALSSYLGVSFAVFLALLPKSRIAFISSLQSRNRNLYLKLSDTEEQLRQVKTRRDEEWKENARVMEVFARHRYVWQQEEERLLRRIDASAEEIIHLKTRIEQLEKSEAEWRTLTTRIQSNLQKRDERSSFLSKKVAAGDDAAAMSTEMCDGSHGTYASAEIRDHTDENFEESKFVGDFSLMRKIKVSGIEDRPEDWEYLTPTFKADDMASLCRQQTCHGRYALQPAGMWTETASGRQDLQYEALEALYEAKNSPFRARKEPPWNLDGESTRLSSKLKLMEQEMRNFEVICKEEIRDFRSLLKKQTKRYQTLSGKIADFCKRMQESDACEPALSWHVRTHRRTEFLLEAFRLQQRAAGARHHLMALLAEMGKVGWGKDQVDGGRSTVRRSLDSIRIHLKEIQRHVEIWLARIVGDLEGVLARAGASFVRD